MKLLLKETNWTWKYIKCIQWTLDVHNVLNNLWKNNFKSIESFLNYSKIFINFPTPWWNIKSAYQNHSKRKIVIRKWNIKINQIFSEKTLNYNSHILRRSSWCSSKLYSTYVNVLSLTVRFYGDKFTCFSGNYEVIVKTFDAISRQHIKLGERFSQLLCFFIYFWNKQI